MLYGGNVVCVYILPSSVGVNRISKQTSFRFQNQATHETANMWNVIIFQVPYFCLPADELTDVIAPSCYRQYLPSQPLQPIRTSGKNYIRNIAFFNQKSWLILIWLIQFVIGKLQLLLISPFACIQQILHESSVRNSLSHGTLKIKIVVWGLGMMLWVGPAALIIPMAQL